MRVMFCGTADFAVPSLEQLAASEHPVTLCVTQPDRPQGRGLKPQPSPVKQAARRLGIPLAQPPRLSAQEVQGMQPDVGVVAAYGQLIPPEVLQLPVHGMVGIHPSLLPQYRGAAPIAWALLNGDATTGVTIFRLTERLDDGPIISQRAVPIDPHEHAEALTNRLAHLGAQELLGALEAIANGTATLNPQDDAKATLAPKLTKAQGTIDWSAPAVRIERLVRAVNPWPGAATIWHGQPLKIWNAAADSSAAAGAVPGTIIKASADAIMVATGQGILAIHEVQSAGRRRMPIKEFLAGHQIKIGERLGV